jgi:DNA-binding response OmpR family regulator
MASMLSISKLGNQLEKVGRAARFSADGDENRVVASGDLRVDLVSGRVMVRGQEIRLDEQEFELLVFLIGHHTNIIAPQTRLNTGSGDISRSDSLRVLSALQKKLESVAGGARYIRTEPWIVCRFDPGTGSGIQ